jgi:2-polyprenyl-6-methoxyphenol hydroxylase-like FAD-dependent oxidoreductase
MSDLPFLVAGGGIGGLAAALGLAGQGRSVRLFEQASAFEEVGAGLQMSPNGVAALRALKAWEAVEPSCVIPSEIHMRDGRSGALLQRIRLGKTFEERFGAPYRVCHRADLLAGLLATARQSGRIELNTGARVLAAEDAGESARLAFADGAPATGTAVIAADGIRSALRASVAAAAPADRHVILYRSLIALEKVPPEIEADCVTLWLFPGGHVVHYPVSNWRNFNIVAAVDGNGADAGWQAPAKASEVARAFTGACDELSGIIAAAPSWRRWPGADLAALPHWSKGRLALLGDAAHATLPFLAQGAVMALEDAVVLSREVSRPQPIFDAFSAYEGQRRPRTAKVQEQSRRMGRIYHARGAVAFARNLTLGLASPDFALKRLEWIYRWTPGA